MDYFFVFTIDNWTHNFLINAVNVNIAYAALLAAYPNEKVIVHFIYGE